MKKKDLSFLFNQYHFNLSILTSLILLTLKLLIFFDFLRLLGAHFTLPNLTQSLKIEVHPIRKAEPTVSVSIRFLHRFFDLNCRYFTTLTLEVRMKFRSLDAPTTVCIYLSEHRILIQEILFALLTLLMAK